ncbi:MAG: hypothetical protein HY921_09305 [Elusimicrobia bacterium]|nr:hypothetical protein [Elusimicrobiota bacterium]
MSTFFDRQKKQNATQSREDSPGSRRALWALLGLAMALMFSPPDWTLNALSRLWFTRPAQSQVAQAFKAAQERRQAARAGASSSFRPSSVKAPLSPNSTEMVKASAVKEEKPGIRAADPEDKRDFDSFVYLDLAGDSSKPSRPLIYRNSPLQAGRFDLGRHRSLRQLRSLVALNMPYRGGRGLSGALEFGAASGGRHFDGTFISGVSRPFMGVPAPESWTSRR